MGVPCSILAGIFHLSIHNSNVLLVNACVYTVCLENNITWFVCGKQSYNVQAKEPHGVLSLISKFLAHDNDFPSF